MRIIIGRWYGQKIRVPEFHKNGKQNEKFVWYKQFVGKDNVFNFSNRFTGEVFGKICKSRLRIKEMG